MAKNNSDKKKKKSSNTKTGDLSNIETEEKMHMPARGLTRM
ncbi:hypothetical protein psyc5s11_24200 [Clostridium gelidum]|uniref:Uncharacterized protein n=1 Tax=Clostridium gelidum TaxID=704125 RepID=A0ABM7T337_9CLOT|nr:hypothetical protein [Clostridium gelidum]BCZ46353.1 hypothetical protein psyc5s11_24200 [Clostridium gelidum]